MSVPSIREHKKPQAFLARIWRLRQRFAASWEGRFALLLALVGIVAGVATYAAFKSLPPFGTNPDFVIWLLNIDLIILLTLGILITRRIVILYALKKRNVLSSKIHMRFVYTFGLVAVAPAVIMMIFSLFFFQYGVQSWFSDRVKTAVSESRAVAESYLKEHHQIIRADILAMANDLNRESTKYYTDRDGFERYVRTQSVIRNLPEVFLFTKDDRTLIKTEIADDFNIKDIPDFAIDRANLGEVMILTDVEDDRVRALVKLQGLPDVYLFVGRPVEANVLNHLSATREAVQRYEEVASRYAGLRLTVTLIYSVVALVLLLASIWYGLAFARRFSTPISDLIETSDKVRQGNFHAKASLASGLDEFDYLGRAFNKMTAQILSQQEELLEANVQLDSRRRFTETILAGVTSGILGIRRNGQITISNSSAGELLNRPAATLVGEFVYDIFADAQDFLDQSYAKPHKTHTFECPFLSSDGSRRVFLIRVAIELIGNEDQAAVITFDDITDLQTAQRKAAWSDVARRIAHEIKNPLTPIQLSAERLKRKYLSSVPEEGRAVFSQCIDTIIRHVGDIGHMVNEFSSFARMPEPVMKPTDVNALIHEIITMNREADQNTTIEFYPEKSFAAVTCDAQQMRQAFTNTLKNALESVQERGKQEGENLVGKVAVSLYSDLNNNMVISVADNGLGLPKNQDPQRLTEPYVTLREKGTGLGLAIVKKIMEDHGGYISFMKPDVAMDDDRLNLGGAMVSLVMPEKQDQVHEILDETIAA